MNAAPVAQTAEAPRLPCRGCGAPLAVDPTAPAARCPACAATTPIPDDLRMRAIAYSRTLETERRRMAGARSTIQFDKIGLYFGPPGALLVGGHIVASMFLDRDAMEYEPSIFVGGLVLLGLAFFAWIAVTVRREMRNANAPPPPPREVVEAFVGSVGSLCSSCGGKVQFTIEQPSARCPFCSAAVYPTQADQAALLAIAAERADLEVARASRATARSLALSFDGGALAAVTSWTRWLSLLLAPGIFLVIGCSLLFQNGLPDFERLDMIATIGAGIAGFGLLLLALFALVFFLVRAFSRPLAIRRTLVQVSGVVGGTIASGLRPAYDWLDAHWAADVTGDVFSAANSDSGARIVRSSLSFSYSGRPAYLVVAHAPHCKRVDLFFSAHRRRAPEYGQSIPAAHEIRSAGWGVIVSNGGTWLTFPDSDPRAFQPATVTWLLQRAAAVAAA